MLHLEQIPSYLPPRAKRLIKNHYFIQQCEEEGEYHEYHVVIYFLSPHRCQVIVRKLSLSPTPIHLQITIESLDFLEKEERTIFYKEENWYEETWECPHFVLEEREITSPKIPKRIMQTFAHPQFQNIQHRDAVMSFIEWNPDYEYVFFDDEACHTFLRDHFEENVMEAYHLLIPKAYQSDLFRTCYIYKMGGFYFDHKQILRQPLSEIVDEKKENVYCLDNPEEYPFCMHNGLFGSVAGTECLWECIQDMVRSILERRDERHPLGLTGPLQFYKFTKEENVSWFFLRNLDQPNYLKQEQIFVKKEDEKLVPVLFRRYDGYYQRDRKEDYSVLCFNFQMYKHTYFCEGRRDILIVLKIPSQLDFQKKEEKEDEKDEKEENISQMTFLFRSLYFHNSLCIQRTDKEQGWTHDLWIRACYIRHGIRGDWKDIHVGPCSYKSKIVPFLRRTF
jgi:hypothetical protein